jgi:hypothetical protein
LKAEQIPSCTHEEEKDESDKDSLFGSDSGTSQACYICLEDFYEGRGEGKVAQPCGHTFCEECWLLWATFLQKMRVVVKCPKCRESVEVVDDW